MPRKRRSHRAHQSKQNTIGIFDNRSGTFAFGERRHGLSFSMMVKAMEDTRQLVVSTDSLLVE